jgi:hypothetical protein
MIAFSHDSASRLACSKSCAPAPHLLEEALRELALFVCQQLEHGVDVGIAPLLEAVDFLLVAQQRKTDRRSELEAMLDGKLLVDGFHHGQDFGYLALDLARLPRATSKKCAIAPDKVFEKVALTIAHASSRSSAAQRIEPEVSKEVVGQLRKTLRTA